MSHPCKITVLIAYSDPVISAGLATTLRRRRDFKVVVCSPELTISCSTDSHFPSPDLVVADYDSGLRLIASANGCRDRVIILTRSDSEAKICHALEQGARGYLLLGCSVKDLMDALRSVHVGGIAVGPLVASRIADWLKQEALTNREGDILGQMMLGLCNKSIASKLAVAVGTVKTHVKSIFKKLDAASRTEAVAIAQRRGILHEDEWRQPRRRGIGVRGPSSLTRSFDGSKNHRRIERSVDSGATPLTTAP